MHLQPASQAARLKPSSSFFSIPCLCCHAPISPLVYAENKKLHDSTPLLVHLQGIEFTHPAKIYVFTDSAVDPQPDLLQEIKEVSALFPFEKF